MNIELSRNQYLSVDILLSGDVELRVLDRKDKIRINDNPEYTVDRPISKIQLSKNHREALAQYLLYGNS